LQLIHQPHVGGAVADKHSKAHTPSPPLPPPKGREYTRGTTIVASRYPRDLSLRAPSCPCRDNGRRHTRRSLLPLMEHGHSCLCGRGSARVTRGMFTGLSPVRFHPTGLAGGLRAGYSSPSQPVVSTVARRPTSRKTDAAGQYPGKDCLGSCGIGRPSTDDPASTTFTSFRSASS